MNPFKSSNKKSRQKKLAIYGVIVLIIVVAGLAFGIFLTKSFTSDNTQTQDGSQEQVANMTEGVSLNEAVAEVRKRLDVGSSDTIEIEFKALKRALLQYLQAANLPEDTKVSVLSADQDQQNFLVTFNIAGVNVDARTTDNNTWELNGANGINTSYSFETQMQMDSSGSDKPVVTNLAIVQKVLGKEAGKLFVDGFKAFCAQEKLNVNNFYADFSGGQGMPMQRSGSTDGNGKVSLFFVYDATNKGTHFSIQVNYEANQNDNILYIIPSDSDDSTSSYSTVWKYEHGILTSE